MKARLLKLHNGQVIWPQRKSLEVVEQLKTVTPRAIWESIYQQNDSVSFGTVFPRFWWAYWQPEGMNLPTVYEVNEEGDLVECNMVTLPKIFTLQMQSWDFSFSEKKSAAMNVGQVWGKNQANSYLLDMVRGHFDMPTATAEVERLAKRWPKARPILIENKANGPAIIQTLRKRVPGIISIEPKGDKVSRANAITPYVEGGNIFLPHPRLYPWVDAFIDEMSMFPGSEYKDIVDTATQVLQRMYNSQVPAGSGARAGTIVTG